MSAKREFWFVVGSQFLYGPEVLETVEGRAREMAEELSKALIKADRPAVFFRSRRAMGQLAPFFREIDALLAERRAGA